MLPEKQSGISILNTLFYRWQFRFLALAVVLMVSLTAGCNSSPTPVETSQEFPKPLASPTIFPTPLPTIQVTPSPTQIVPSPTPGYQICTPLSGYELSELSDMIVNPYTAPPPGSDMPHEGIDLAVVLAQTGIAMEGNPVQALLPGTIAVSLQNRFPYGNALIIETPLEQLPPQSIEQLVLPAPIPTLPAHPSLTCPTTDSNIDEAWQVNQRSLYLVYAHLKDPPQPAARRGSCMWRYSGHDRSYWQRAQSTPPSGGTRGAFGHAAREYGALHWQRHPRGDGSILLMACEWLVFVD